MNRIIEVEHVHVRAYPYAGWFYALREAALLALTENRVVHLQINGRMVVVDPSDLLEPLEYSDEAKEP